MKNQIITCLFVLLGIGAFAQTNNNEKAEIGTYQIIFTSKVEEVFTVEAYNALRIQIEKARHATEEKEIIVSEYSKVRVLPVSVIQAKGFRPLPEFAENK